MTPNPTIPAVPNALLPEKRKAGRPPGSTSKKSKADDMEDKAYGFIMEMFANYEVIKGDASFQQRLAKDPYLASTLTKDLSQLAKRILDITVAKLRIEELKSQKGSGETTGNQVVFILQGRDTPVVGQKIVEVNPQDAVASFKTVGRD
jgi:hypothetical protein